MIRLMINEVDAAQCKGVKMNSTEGSQDGTFRKNATIAGILYILGTVSGVLSVIFTQPVTNAEDYFSAVTANENRVVIGALFILLMGLVLAMVPVVLFPILKKVNEVFALGYIVFRGGLETFTYIVTTICFLLLLPLSREFVEASAPQDSYFQTLGTLLRGVAGLPMTVFIFGLGALILYSLLYQSSLIPRWITIWGFIAIILHLATGFLIVFGWAADDSQLVSLINLPIFLQEMVMAVWLIVKGFEPTAMATLNAKTNPGLEGGK
jgi:hypothetical protein